jgi:uncharacterized protein YbjT (DUF2867 family)
MTESKDVFVAGATGYMGRQLVQALLDRKHRVGALARVGSERKVPRDCRLVSADPLTPATFSEKVAPADTWVHLIGVPHPSPNKAEQFKSVDLKSIEAAVPVALASGIRHFVYVSVAHPAPMMKSYIEVRSRCEELIRSAGLNATFLRPWYVLGPGHRWPYLLKPMYSICERIPSTSQAARRLGLVTLQQMVGALLYAIENPATGVRIMEVPEIRQLGSSFK